MFRSTIQQQIEATLAEREPLVEVLQADINGENVELYIDHPDGVTLDLCERVTNALSQLREQHGLTVSSPGPARPLTKPEHFARYTGHLARIRSTAPHDGRKTFIGEIVAVSDKAVTLAVDGAIVTIAFDDIHRSNLAES